VFIRKDKEHNERPVSAFIHSKNTTNITACVGCYRPPRLSYL
jgi:hypothetical protein